MGRKDRFRQSRGLEKRETEKRGVAYPADQHKVKVAGRHGLNQYSIYRDADEDQNPLKRKRKQGFKIVVSDLPPFPVSPSRGANYNPKIITADGSFATV